LNDQKLNVAAAVASLDDALALTADQHTAIGFFCGRVHFGDGGERIFLATDRYIGFWEATQRPRTVDYPFTYIELRLGPDGTGEGVFDGDDNFNEARVQASGSEQNSRKSTMSRSWVKGKKGSRLDSLTLRRLRCAGLDVTKRRNA
jgi:hypothetical protein